MLVATPCAKGHRHSSAAASSVSHSPRMHRSASCRRYSPAGQGDQGMNVSRRTSPRWYGRRPSLSWASRLKHAKGARNDAHPFSGHAGVARTICHRDRKRVHGKAHAQQCTVEKKQKTHSITECLLDHNLQNYGAAKTKPGIGARARPVSGHLNELHVLGVVLRTAARQVSQMKASRTAVLSLC